MNVIRAVALPTLQRKRFNKKATVAASELAEYVESRTVVCKVAC
jgi:hypothetical protein